MDIDAQQVSQTKELVKFVKELTALKNVESLISLLKSDLHKFKKVKGPILALARAKSELRLYFYQGAQIVKKVVPGVWPQQQQIRVNDISDSQYLANIFGRPFAKLVTVPLQIKRKSQEENVDVSAVLFYEHSLTHDAARSFIIHTEERLPLVSIALDRLLLEYDLNEGSRLWERTFDGLKDPVAIFDAERKILRANRSFATHLAGLPNEQLFSENFIFQGRYYETRSYPILLTQDLNTTNIINHYVDCTLSHQLRQQMIQNDKMAALGQLAGNIAHELNNPLTGIRSLAQILLAQVSSERGQLHADLKEVEHAAERCQIIIKNLREFSSEEYADLFQVVTVNQIIEKTLPLLKTLIRRYELYLRLEPDQSAKVFVEPQLMQQVVFNIIKNAAQAMGETGSLTIETRTYSQADQKWSEIRISDTGPGIAPEIKDQIFDYFFTTKSQGQGTGLGLSMSRSIVDRFGGEIHVESAPGQGSIFVIQLPVCED